MKTLCAAALAAACLASGQDAALPESPESPVKARAVLSSAALPAAAASSVQTPQPRRDFLAEAQAAARARDFQTAAPLFFEAQSSEDADDRLRAEAELAHALAALGFFDAAMHQYDYVLRAGPNHPAYAEAAEGLTMAGSLAGDDVLSAAILDREYGDGFARLPPHILDRINEIIGTMSLRAGRLDEAGRFLEPIPDSSPDAARADWMKGLIAARQGRHEAALELFRRAEKGAARMSARTAVAEQAPVPTVLSTQSALLAMDEAKKRGQSPMAGARLSSEELGQLAVLAEARTLYALGRFGEAVMAYERLPRFSRFWEDALFENGWARMQNEDDGGALGTLEALHAPQLSRSFQPESRILAATIYFTRCLFPEARRSLKNFEAVYLPQRDALRSFLDARRTPDEWRKAAAAPGAIPEPVRLELIRSQRYAALLSSLERVEREGEAIASASGKGWTEGKFRGVLLERNVRSREILSQVLADFIEKRLRDAEKRITAFDAKKEIIGLEIERVEGEQLETRFDRRRQLAGQKLGRPAMKDSQHVYWPFDGEFWLDEVGRYQMTLKDGCMPARDEEKETGGR